MIGEPENDRCYFCGGKLKAQRATIPFVLNGSVIVIKNVPAFVCTQCGEAIMDNSIARRVDEMLKQIYQIGSEVSVLTYADEAVLAPA